MATLAKQDSMPTSRPGTPPPLAYQTFAARGVVPRNFDSFKPKDVKSGVRDPVTCVAWSCDGARLASCGDGKTIRIWSPERTIDSRLSKALTGGHDAPVGHIAWNPMTPFSLCSVSRGDKKVVFWDVRQTKAVFAMKTPGEIMSIEYSPSGKSVLALSQDDGLYFIESHQPVGSSLEWNFGPRHDGWGQVNHATFNHAGDLVLIGQSSGAIEVLNYPDLSTWEKFQAHGTSCYTLALDPRGIYVATGGADAIINLFDSREWICHRTFSGSDTPVRDLSFSFDGEYLASASDSSGVDIWEVESGMFLHHIPGVGPSATIAWHPSKHILASGGDGGSDTKLGWVSFFGI